MINGVYNQLINFPMSAQHLPSDVDSPPTFQEVRPLDTETRAAQQPCHTQGYATDDMKPPFFQTQEASGVHEPETHDTSQESTSSPEVIGLFTNLPEGEELEKYLVANIEVNLRARSSANAKPISTVGSKVEQTDDGSQIAASAGSKRKSSTGRDFTTLSRKSRTKVTSVEQEFQTPSVNAEETARLLHLAELTEIVAASKRHGGSRKLTVQELRDFVTDADVRMYRDGFEDQIKGMRDWTDDELRFNIVYEQAMFAGSFAEWRSSNEKRKKDRNRENRRRRSKGLTSIT